MKTTYRETNFSLHCCQSSLIVYIHDDTTGIVTKVPLIPFPTYFYQNVHRNLLLTSASGRQVSAVTVFAHSLCYFKERFIQEIQDQSTTGVVETAIRWVITVPAIWSPSAKQFVRLAAFEVCKYTI